MLLTLAEWALAIEEANGQGFGPSSSFENIQAALGRLKEAMAAERGR
ncbi:hypothetical protein [Muricoccus roseus]|nr:hypothetical protein [Roseomonas rosea]